MRDEIVHYPKLTDAERELNLRPTDFAPWRPWLKASLVGEGAAEEEARLAARIEAALVHLKTKGGGRDYIRAIVPVGIDLVTTIGKLRAGPPELPSEFQAKLDERDRFVDAEARAHALRLTGKARGAS